MAAAEKTTNLLEFPCTKCGTMFKRRPGGRATCSSACAKAAQRQQKAPKVSAREKKIKRRKERLIECAFGYWLIEQARRAGTVQTYHGIDAGGLHQLHDLHKYRKQRYGWVGKGHGQDVFQLCHVQPLKGRDGSTGLTIPESLFTGITELNQKQGNKPVKSWAGASLPATALQRKWDITDDMTRDQVLQKIADLLGPELDTFLDELAEMPQRTVRLRLAGAVYKHQGDELYESLDRRYTLAELQSLKLEQLQALDATQRGQISIKAFSVGNCQADSQLGVLHDELARFSDILPEGQHRDNCRSMLALVRVLGIYLTQVRDAEGTARNRFLGFPNAMLNPLGYLHHDRPWKTPVQLIRDDLHGLLYGVSAADGKKTKPGIIPTAQDALQGLEIPVEHLRNRLLKRLTLDGLGPVVQAPNQWTWEACGSNWPAYIDNMYASLEPTWQALVDAGLCDEEQVLEARDAALQSLVEAVEYSQKLYREQRRFTVYGVPFDKYPAWIEYSPVVAALESLFAA